MLLSRENLLLKALWGYCTQDNSYQSKLWPMTSWPACVLHSKPNDNSIWNLKCNLILNAIYNIYFISDSVRYNLSVFLFLYLYPRSIIGSSDFHNYDGYTVAALAASATHSPLLLPFPRRRDDGRRLKGKSVVSSKKCTCVNSPWPCAVHL